MLRLSVKANLYKLFESYDLLLYQVISSVRCTSEYFGDLGFEPVHILDFLAGKIKEGVIEFIETHAGPPYTKELGQAYQVLERLSSPDWAIVSATNGLSKMPNACS